MKNGPMLCCWARSTFHVGTMYAAWSLVAPSPPQAGAFLFRGRREAMKPPLRSINQYLVYWLAPPFRLGPTLFMELRHLRYFVAVTSHGSFTRAAEVLHISQPPLSRQVKDLEEELGVTLLVRGSNSVKLTDAGEQFYGEACEVLARADDAVRRMRGEKGKEVLRVGYTSSTATGIIAGVLARFHASAPRVRIELVDHSSREMIEMASEGRLDFVICPKVTVPNGIPGFQWNVPINVLFFKVFQDGDQLYLSRTWLLDPVETESKATATDRGPRAPWNGEFYVSYGVSDSGYRWEDAVKFGFICAGGGRWYSQTLDLLSAGDRVWVNVPRHGYVGVGTVKGTAVRADEFEVVVDGSPRKFIDLPEGQRYAQDASDEERANYFVSLDWLATRPLSQAVSQVGFFGNQNSVCKPRTSKWPFTVETLAKVFGVTV